MASDFSRIDESELSYKMNPSTGVTTVLGCVACCWLHASVIRPLKVVIFSN